MEKSWNCVFEFLSEPWVCLDKRSLEFFNQKSVPKYACNIPLNFLFQTV